jgi:dolichol-phosphate mannosyltransferase
MTIIAAYCLILLLFQGVCFLILLARLWRGARRLPPLQPQEADLSLMGKVSVIIPTLNEANRLEPMLAGISRQTYEVREIIVVDSNSVDGTTDKVKQAAEKDPRIRLITDPPLPAGWVGRPWALHNGFLATSPDSEWLLGIDADTQPQKGLIPSLLNFADTQGYDILSLSPQFILKSAGEWWLQPALLMTLIYRFESSGVEIKNPETLMANGQCFLIKRKVLEALNGYTCASSSFCDDVTLARYAATQGYQVGFADGANVIKVRMYEGLKDTWQGWGRSLDLKDAATKVQLWAECGFLFLIQALPLPLVVLLSLNFARMNFLSYQLLLGLNLLLLLIRFALLIAVAPSYELTNSINSYWFWFSPLADTLAVTRIWLSALTKPKNWRGRVY